MSKLERALQTHMIAVGLPIPEQEYKFHPMRDWRLDFAWPARMIACECDGGLWIDGGGGHNRPLEYIKDCKKRNAATLLGWRVFNFTTNMIESGEAVATLEKAFMALDS